MARLGREVPELGTIESVNPRNIWANEALDFTPARQSGNEAFTPVCTFMAHHQGMAFLSLAYLQIRQHNFQSWP